MTATGDVKQGMSQSKDICGGWPYVTNRPENAMNGSIGGLRRNPDWCVNPTDGSSHAQEQPDGSFAGGHITV